MTKVHPKTGHGRPEENRGITLSLISELDGASWSTSRPIS